MTTRYDRDGITIHEADYRETLKSCNGDADLIATSPPYCDARTYGADVSWTMDDYAALGDAVWGALKPGGHALINVDAPVRDWTKDKRGTERGLHPWRLLLDWHDRIGFRVPDRLAFGRRGLPGEYRGRFRNDWEPLLWFQKPGARGWMDKRTLVIKSPSQRLAGASATQRLPNGHKRQTNAAGWAVDAGVSHRGTLWDYGSVGNSQSGSVELEAENHPARWPYRLAIDIVRCFSPPGGLVCDPFLGAGTTAAAASDWGRRFIGGDSGRRQDDGVLWADVAARVVDERNRQAQLF